VEGGTRKRCHQNSLESAGSSTRWDGGKHGARSSTGGDGGKHQWLAQLWAGMCVQAGSQTVQSLQGQGWELAIAYTVRIPWETGPVRVAEANAGTREQGRELALAYIWHTHMETGPRRVKEAIAGTAQIHCRRRMTPACRWGPASSSQASKQVCVGVCLAPEGWRAQSYIVRQGTARNGTSADQWAQRLLSHPKPLPKGF